MGGIIMKAKEAIGKYINYRQSLGELFKTNSSILRSFCKSLGEDAELSCLSTEAILRFIYMGHEQRISTCYRRNVTLRGFFAWAKSRNLISDNPLPALNLKYAHPLRPCIYTAEELRRIFDTSLIYQKHRSVIFPEMVYYTLVFTYVMGLRISETLKIKLGDINLDQSYIRIIQTKFHKSRMVTYNNTVKNKIIECLSWRRTVGLPCSNEDFLLLNRKSQPLRISTMDNIFMRIREKSGIKREADRKHQPHIHSLRHTFAVNRITKWYKEEKNVQTLLPILSIYMGHAKLEHTAVYITMTDDLLEEANRLFENFTNK